MLVLGLACVKELKLRCWFWDLLVAVKELKLRCWFWDLLVLKN